VTFLSAENAFGLVRGSTLVLTFKLAEDDGSPVNLTGARAILSVKGKAAAEPLPLVVKDSRYTTPPLGCEITDARGGVARITFFPKDTHSLAPGTYFFDLWVILADGSRIAAIPESQMELSDSITHIPL